MDFLDPRKRRARHLRLMIGYFLVAVAIVLGAIILVYGADGYGINTKTGQIIQNGLLFVDSKPGGAEIFLNGVDQNNTTSARLILPAGNYTMKLAKSGYTDWQRDFTLEASSIDRFVYPMLFPVKPVSTPLRNYSSQPGLITQSPNQQWLLVQVPGLGSANVTFDEYDTTDLTKAPIQLSLPAGLLSGTEGSDAVLSQVEWSTDNKNVLLKHPVGGSYEFIVFNRDTPAASFNVNRLLGFDPAQVSLRDKKIDTLYVFNQNSLQVYDVGKNQLADPLLKNVLAYQPYGTDLIAYVTNKDTKAGQVQARVWDNGPTYPFYNFSAGSHYVVDLAQYSGHFYYVAGSDTQSRVDIFQDPLSDIKDPSIGKALPLIALNVLGVSKEGFSNNARFIEVENGQGFGVYDLETGDAYQYRLKDPLSDSLKWMDGHRMIGQTGGNVFVTDYDSTNQRIFVPTTYNDGGFFSADYNHLVTTQAKSDGSTELVNVDMRAGSDLPKNSQG